MSTTGVRENSNLSRLLQTEAQPVQPCIPIIWEYTQENLRRIEGVQ